MIVQLAALLGMVGILLLLREVRTYREQQARHLSDLAIWNAQRPRTGDVAPHEMIPAGVALRLHRIYFDVDLGAVLAGDATAIAAAEDARENAGARLRDQHAVLADCAALADYFAEHGHVDLTVAEDPGVVPWSYRRYRGLPAQTETRAA